MRPSSPTPQGLQNQYVTLPNSPFCGVHTLVWRSMQVYHELQELEEEDKGREEVQEIERESQVEENHSHGHDYGDAMKRTQTS